jgi:ORF6N domain
MRTSQPQATQEGMHRKYFMKSIVPIEVIEHKILFIRGQKVILDRDLALLYGVETRVLNQAVRRNSDRFPDDFMFSLTREEIARISQSVTSSDASFKTLKFSKNVMAFTEYGIAMLSSVLNSQRAIQVNIQIMRTFGKLREMISSHKDLSRKLNDLEKKYDGQFQVVFEAIRQLIEVEEKPKRKIGFIVKESQAVYKKARKRGMSKGKT